MYFTPETFQQANPILSGMGSAQSLIGQAIQNRMANTQANYLPSTLQQQLLSAQLKNQTQQIQNQYLPPELQSEIGLKQAQIPLTEAQTGLTQAETQYFPLTTQAKLYQGMGDYMRGAYYMNPAMWASRFQNNPAFESMVANNPQLAQQYGSLMAGSLFSNPMMMPNPGMQGNAAIPAGPMSSPNMGARMSMPPAGMQGSQPTPQSLPLSAGQINTLSNLFPTNQNDTSNVQNALSSALIEKTVPKPIQSQRYYEQSVENLMGQVAPDMPQISQFAGLAGHARLSADKYAAAANLSNDPSYIKFNNFANVQAPLIANEMRRAFGGQATDSEREVMDHLANPVYWKNNPQLALSQFNTLSGMLKANAQALTQTPAQNLGTLQKSIQNPVKAQASQMQMPKFNSKQEFQSWYMNLNPAQQLQVKNQLGSQ